MIKTGALGHIRSSLIKLYDFEEQSHKLHETSGAGITMEGEYYVLELLVFSYTKVKFKKIQPVKSQ